MNAHRHPPDLTDRGWTASAKARRQVVLFALLGYAYLAGVAAVLVASIILISGTPAAGLAWIPVVLLVLLVSALRVRFPPVEGRKVTGEEAPGLFELIDDVGRGTAAPTPDEVFLTAELNASIAELPRLWLFGSRRVMTIGLPLLHALPEEEARAILAHELAHLSLRHGRKRIALGRLVTTWTTLAVATQWSRTWAAFLFVPFFRWYAPRLQSLVETESRGHELESDHLAARAAGRAPTARALLRIAFLQAFLERFVWPEIHGASAHLAAPPSDAVSRVLRRMEDHLGHPDGPVWIRRQLRDRALVQDSHPSLTDRLHALGVPARPENAPELIAILEHGHGVSAAEALLGRDAVDRYAADLGLVWVAAVEEEWRRWHADARLWRADQDSAESGSAYAEAAEWARARWAAACEPAPVAIPLIEAVLTRAPGNGEARVLLGTLLLDHADVDEQERGAILLEEAMADASTFALNAAEALRRHYARLGREPDARRCETRQRQLDQAFLTSLRDRGGIRYSDTLRPYSLPPVALTGVREELRAQPQVRRAYLVQKQVKRFESTPMAVLAVELEVPWYRSTTGGIAEAVCGALAERLTLPDTVFLLVVAVDRHSRVCRRLRKLAGAEVYRSHEPLPDAEPTPEWSTPSRVAAMLSPPVLISAATFGLAMVLVAFAGSRDSPPVSYSERLADLEATVQRTPEDPRSNLELAWALIELERFEEAEPVARKAVQLNPEDAYAHNSLGWVLMRRDRFEEAVPHFRTAVRLDRDHEYAHRNLGWSLHQLRRDDEAEHAYREAVRVASGDAAARFGLGAVLARLRRYDEAEAEMRRAIRLDPDQPIYLGLLGDMLKGSGRSDEALRVYREGTRAHPEDPQFWVEIGMIEHVKGRHPEAVEAFREAERLDPHILEGNDLARGMLHASLNGREYVPR